MDALIRETRRFTKKEIIKRIDNHYNGITDKTGPWNFKKIL